MHDLPHYTITPMYQCMFMIFNQTRTIIKIYVINKEKNMLKPKIEPKIRETRLNKD